MASQHLSKLRFAGLVVGTRDGQRVVYRLRGGHVRALLSEALSKPITTSAAHPSTTETQPRPGTDSQADCLQRGRSELADGEPRAVRITDFCLFRPLGVGGAVQRAA